MYWITYRANGKTFQDHFWATKETLAISLACNIVKGASWWRLTNENGRVVLEG